jgi:hypothetical protein
MLRILLFCAILAGTCAAAEPVATRGPSADVPELQPLNLWAGTWDSELTVKPNADLPKGGKAKGTATAEWIHDGRFLRQTWAMDSADGIPKMNGSTLMTYDTRKKTYRSWSFFSTGVASEAEGVWDAKARKMTWTSRDAESGQTTVTTATFGADGSETWSIVAKDRDGKVVNEVNGKNTRRAK